MTFLIFIDRQGRKRSETREEAVELEDHQVKVVGVSGEEDSGKEDFKIGEVFKLAFKRRIYFGKGHSVPTGQ